MFSFVLLSVHQNILHISSISLILYCTCYVLSNAFLHLLKCSWNFYLSFYWCGELLYWLAYVEPYLHPRNKPLLVMMYNSFNVFLTSVENICTYIHQGYCSVVFCGIFIWSCYQSNATFIEWVWKCSFFLNIFEEFEANWY